MQPTRVAAALFLGALAVRLLWLPLMPYAVYPDAAYYDAAARAIAAGRLEIPFLWSWIETGFVIPTELVLPLPAFAHWGPLASLIGAPFVLLFGGLESAPAIPHLLAGAALAPLTYLMALRLGAARPLPAAILAAIGGLYGPLLSQPDNFALYALLATLALLAAGRARGGGIRGWLLAGLIAGFAWLSRTDGLILAGSVGLLALAEPGLRARLAASAAVIAGFALPALPWIARQVATFGSAVPSGSSGAIWIRDYNEQFTADGAFTIGHLFEKGLLPVLGSRLEASWVFLSTGAIWLLAISFLPGLIVAIWTRRSDRRLAPFAIYAIAYALWSILFAAPHLPGGNLLHGLLALGPISWILATEGMPRLLTALEARRLVRPGADRRIGRVLLPLVIGISILSPLRATIPAWEGYERLGDETSVALRDAGLADRVIMTTAPAPLWRSGGHRAVLLPLSPVATVERAIVAAGVGALVLDPAYRPDLIERWGDEDRPGWLGEPIELRFEGDGNPRTLLIIPVVAPPTP